MENYQLVVSKVLTVELNEERNLLSILYLEGSGLAYVPVHSPVESGLEHRLGLDKLGKLKYSLFNNS